MIETIRKHSKWLLWIIAGLTIASFLFFMGAGPARNGGGGYSSANTNLVSGEIYGQKVTPDLYEKTSKDVDLYYLFSTGGWPERNPNITQDELLKNIYIRMMLVEKAQQLGIHVNDSQAAQAAANYLHSPRLLRALGVNAESVPFDAFRNQVLQPHGLTADDFENFVRNDLAVEQLQQIYGLSGQLVTPQEAAEEYVRDNREFSTQIIFFSASNFLDHVTVSPADVGQFYTNYMADYRLPNRVQVSYVLFSVTNYLDQALKEMGSSNVDLQVENAYDKYGMKATPDAKTPEEAKAEIRNIVLRQQSLANAVTQADLFAQSVFNVSSSGNKAASADDLFTIARQEGLSVETPVPFAADYGPSEFVAPAAFTSAAFSLQPDSPISEPVPTQDGVYVIALQTNLPTEIPPLDEIHPRVANDLRFREATILAQRIGTNFVRTLALQMASGKSFAAVGIAQGLSPEVLPPFSLSTQDLPELGDRAALINQLKEAAFATPVGTTSRFMDTEDGGFILYVSSRPPVDEAKMKTDLPQFIAELRERRLQDAFNQWLQLEGSRELRGTPLAKQMGLR